MTSQNSLNNETYNANFTANRIDSGAQAVTAVAHSQNTAGSDAKVRAQVAGTSAGDAFFEAAAGAARAYAFGMDTSTTDHDLKLTTAVASSVTPSTGTNLMTIQAVSPDTFPRAVSDILVSQFQYNAPGNSVQTQVIQQDATNAASHAIDRISTPVGGGDPMTQWVKEGVINHIMGLASTDNSLRIGNGGSPSALATERWRMTVAGERTMPLQPAFYAYLSASDANVTGNGATYLLGSGNILTITGQQGTGLATNGVFTAPVQGFYHFEATLFPQGITPAMTLYDMFFFVNGVNNIYGSRGNLANLAVPGTTDAIINTTVSLFLAAGATVQVAIIVQNGAGNTITMGGGTGGGSVFSTFSGFLVC